MSKIISTSTQRLDVFLSTYLNLSRNQIATLIKNEKVKVNSKIVKASFKLNIDDEIEYEFIQAKEKENKYEAKFDVEIIYEDDDILLINKPINVATHGASSLKEASLVEWLLQNNYKLCDINGNFRAGIVHRLDKATSGALIVAKNNSSYEFLANEIKNRLVDRIYLAITNDFINKDYIECYIKRNEKNRLKMQALSLEECKKKYKENIDKYGKLSKTNFINLDKNNKAALIAAKLQSGRTHQIRVSLASVNRYILGDTLYAKNQNEKRLMLHSFFIAFTHPQSKKRMQFIANFDENFKEKLQEFKKETYDKDYALRLLRDFSI